MRTVRRVLVIEDHVDSGEMLKEFLELEGHHVTLATDARAGLRQVREVLPDLVICDIGLPGMDGCEFARIIRADRKLRQPRLFALSGYASPEDERRAIASGFDRFFAKPVDMTLLSLAIDE